MRSAALLTLSPMTAPMMSNRGGATGCLLGVPAFSADGTTTSAAGGGRLEQTILAYARVALAERKSRLTHYTLREEGDDAIGALCGGEVRAFIKLFAPRPTLLIVGGAPIGQPLAEMARVMMLDWVKVE